MSPEDVLKVLPMAFEGARALAGLVSPKAIEGVNLGQEITTFIIDAEQRGLTQEAIIEGINDLVVKLDERLKFGG